MNGMAKGEIVMRLTEPADYAHKFYSFIEELERLLGDLRSFDFAEDVEQWDDAAEELEAHLKYIRNELDRYIADYKDHFPRQRKLPARLGEVYEVVDNAYRKVADLLYSDGNELFLSQGDKVPRCVQGVIAELDRFYEDFRDVEQPLLL